MLYTFPDVYFGVRKPLSGGTLRLAEEIMSNVFISTIQQNVTTTWNVSSTVTLTVQALWNVDLLVPVGQSAQALWNVDTGVQQTVQTLWNVSGSIQHSAQAIWDVDISVQQSTQAVWDVRILVPLIPPMISDTLPSGWVTSDTPDVDPFAAWKAFDADYSATFWVGPVLPKYVQYQFPTQQCAVLYRIYGGFEFKSPTDWIIYGSNNGTGWYSLDVQTAQSISDAPAYKDYTILSPVSYYYYRFSFTHNSNWDDSTSVVSGLQLYG